MKKPNLWTTASLVVALWVVYGVEAGYADEITECDRLVAHPLDPDKIAPGVPTAEVPHVEGIAACNAAVVDDPDNARLNYQLGRVYFYAGQPEKALPHLKTAAAGGYRQAQFVLGLIVDGERGGADRDPCLVEDLWAKSARAGRLAAMVSYPHHVLRGRFDGCTLQVDDSEMMSLLEKTKERSLDYYQGLLVNDLIADLKTRMAQ